MQHNKKTSHTQVNYTSLVKKINTRIQSKIELKIKQKSDKIKQH